MSRERTGDPSGSTVESVDHPPGQPKLRLEFHSDDLGEPFREHLDETVSITVDSIVRLPDGTHLQYWTVKNGSQEGLFDTIEAFPTTLAARLLSTVGNTHRVEVRGSGRSLFSVFHTFDGVTKSAVYDERGVQVVADFPPHVDVGDVERAVHDVYPDLDLVSSREIITAESLRPLVDEQLTDRQSLALRLAYYGGYFEQPRQSTGEELAERMGISKQAFHRHLRNAYAVVFEELLGAS